MQYYNNGDPVWARPPNFKNKDLHRYWSNHFLVKNAIKVWWWSCRKNWETRKNSLAKCFKTKKTFFVSDFVRKVVCTYLERLSYTQFFFSTPNFFNFFRGRKFFRFRHFGKDFRNPDQMEWPRRWFSPKLSDFWDFRNFYVRKVWSDGVPRIIGRKEKHRESTSYIPLPLPWKF